MSERTVVLPTDADVNQAERIASEFLSALVACGKGSALVVDATGVERIDSAFGQVLVALFLETRKSAISLRWQGKDAAALLQAAFATDHLESALREILP